MTPAHRTALALRDEAADEIRVLLTRSGIAGSLAEDAIVALIQTQHDVSLHEVRDAVIPALISSRPGDWCAHGDDEVML